MAVAGAVGAASILGGCVVAPPGYGAYGETVYAAPGAPVVVAPPVSVGIGIGGAYYGGRGYYGGGGGYYGGGRGYYGGRGYGRPGYWR
ncbi:hypothetical protein QTI66_02965 [Variovorax sp. J22R133]|uniref:hypothetical protein n=1 Tax=Variovorax brevis TaxID=3053503 RepID=UPI0025774C53|nr:hypothetical protein [Variovorax sp. J22R133]MDM0111090.1 hypothetical protein [Variovorax sp. J22R133]